MHDCVGFSQIQSQLLSCYLTQSNFLEFPQVWVIRPSVSVYIILSKNKPALKKCAAPKKAIMKKDVKSKVVA